MPDVIEPAKSGRAKCRCCSKAIAKGELRFGEAVPNLYGDGEGEATHWFHLACAAEKRPVKLDAALATSGDEIPDRQRLVAIAAEGVANPELCRVQCGERAPSGRARCRQCRELIPKGSWRVVMENIEDQSGMMPAYFVHAGCAAAHVGAQGLAAKLRRCSLLDAGDVEALIREAQA